MAKAAVRKKVYPCLRCSKRSIYGKVSGICCGLKVYRGEHKQESKHRWKDQFMGGHHMQRIFDVDKVNTLIRCQMGKRVKIPCKLKDSTGGPPA